MARNTVSILARVMIAFIFLMSAVGNKIPKFNEVASAVAAEGVPMPGFMLFLAIILLVAGSLSVVVGYRVEWGAGMLLAFLIGATYYFHDFWNFDGPAQQQQMISFLKNVSLMGTMLFLAVNGAGAGSLNATTDAKSAPNDVDE